MNYILRLTNGCHWKLKSKVTIYTTWAGLSLPRRQLLLSLGLPVAKTRDWVSPPPRPQSSSLLVPVVPLLVFHRKSKKGAIKGVACGGGYV